MNTLKELIIPGYLTLNYESQLDFERSDAGKKFLYLIKNTIKSADQLNQSRGLFSTWLGNFNEQKELSRDQFVTAKDELIVSIQNTPEYKKIQQTITYQNLDKVIPEFKLLDNKQKTELSEEESSQAFITELNIINRLLAEKTEDLTQMSLWAKMFPGSTDIASCIRDLTARHQNAVTSWKKKLFHQPEYSQYRKTIVAQQAQQVSAYFPNLSYRKVPANHQDQFFADTIEEDLEQFFYDRMQEINRFEMKFVNLNEFHQTQAKIMAEELLRAFRENSQPNLEHLFSNYQDELVKAVVNFLKSDNGIPLIAESEAQNKPLQDSLSFIWKNRAITQTNEFIGRLADAHGFIQATSFSTQNESSFLAILDIYNYARYHKQISETKTIFSSLLKPLYPLYEEYRDIGLYEKNPFWKYIRILTPIVITVAVVISLTVLLGPLALPELAIVAVFIPAILIGLGVATLYAAFKNDLYKSLRDSLYGGPFEIPEFQVNERMQQAFKSKEIADRVQEFYIEELELCDELEKQYEHAAESGLLSEEEIDKRATNKKRRYTLALEWYDIHSNEKLGYEHTPQIVLKTIEQTSLTEYSDLEKALKNEKQSMNQSAKLIGEHLKEKLQHKENPQAKAPQHHQGLFKIPKCLGQKVKVHDLVDLRNKIDAI